VKPRTTSRRNLKLTVQYDGTSFHGWQRQPNTRTVEGVLEEALCGLCAEQVLLEGASRTDQGVHSRGQVANFHIDSPIPTNRFGAALNGRLPTDVRISDVEEESPDFHARFLAQGKHYRYLLDRRPVSGVFLSRYALHCPGPLDAQAMKAAAAYFVGEHDFVSFQCASGNPCDSTVRTVYGVLVEEKGDLMIIDVWGKSFLYKMVRTMVGTLLEVGRGKRRPEEIRDCLEARDRRSSGTTVEGRGLCLVSVYYDKALLLKAMPAKRPLKRPLQEGHSLFP